MYVSLRSRRRLLLLVTALVTIFSAVMLNLTFQRPVIHATGSGDVRVSSGSPSSPFSQNKQNEPSLAIDANHPNVMVAGSNDEIDMEACNAGDDTTCPFTPGVGTSGVYFSFDSGQSWIQPTYTGLTARNCVGVVGNSDADCTPQQGPIGTLPKYFENGLVSDGDPAVAFGPRPGADGTFTWSNGSRLYFANLSANLGTTRDDQTFKGAEAIAVSRTDNVVAASQGDATAWMDPVLLSKQSSTTFSDKEQIWADNASSSLFFGHVYVCWASFRSNGGSPSPLVVATSADGGTTWTERQVTAAANNGNIQPLDGCTIRTDSHGNVYVFGIGTDSGSKQHFEYMVLSTDGGQNWEKPVQIPGAVTLIGEDDPVIGRPVEDGVAGARNDLAWAPSVDIANGAPTGADATNRLVMTYVTGTTAAPHVIFRESTDGGMTWSVPRSIETGPQDRGYYTAPAISPNGKDVYVVYNAFTTPFQTTTATPRSLVGVVLHADTSTNPTTPTGAFQEIHRGASGDPRASSQNDLTAEFLGDYVYAAATRTYGAAVWNDTRNGSDCPALDAWRQSLRTGGSVARPAPQQACPASFGNSDIYGGSFSDPTP